MLSLTLSACSDSTDVTRLTQQIAALQTQVAATPTPATISPFLQQLFSTTPTPEPDRVVGTEWRCTEFRNSDSRTFDIDEPTCATETPPAGVQVYNRRQLVTVRTYAGTTYVVSVAPDAKVMIGQTWPPGQ